MGKLGTKERLYIVKFTFVLVSGQSRIAEVGTPASLPSFFFPPVLSLHLVILAYLCAKKLVSSFSTLRIW